MILKDLTKEQSEELEETLGLLEKIVALEEPIELLDEIKNRYYGKGASFVQQGNYTEGTLILNVLDTIMKDNDSLVERIVAINSGAEEGDITPEDLRFVVCLAVIAARDTDYLSSLETGHEPTEANSETLVEQASKKLESDYESLLKEYVSGLIEVSEFQRRISEHAIAVSGMNVLNAIHVEPAAVKKPVGLFDVSPEKARTRAEQILELLEKHSGVLVDADARLAAEGVKTHLNDILFAGLDVNEDVHDHEHGPINSLDSHLTFEPHVVNPRDDLGPEVS